MADYISTHTGTEIDTTLDEVANKINTTSIGVTVQGYNANTTTQGNTFNNASQLVQLDGTGKLPAVDGSLLTNLPMVLLQTVGVTSSVSSVEFTGLSGYNRYEIHINDTVASGAEGFNMQVGSSGVYDTGNNYYDGGSLFTSAQLNGLGNYQNQQMLIKITGLSSAIKTKILSEWCSYTSTPTTATNAMLHNLATAYDSIKIFLDTNTINSGSISIYGIKG